MPSIDTILIEISPNQVSIHIRNYQRQKERLKNLVEKYKQDPWYIEKWQSAIASTERMIGRISAKILVLSSYLYELTNSTLHYANEDECYESAIEYTACEL
jgi:predicted transcriptional regulator